MTGWAGVRGGGDVPAKCLVDQALGVMGVRGGGRDLPTRFCVHVGDITGRD